jgi:MFS transporter, FSR family, fosmidomycin resistance protein
MTSADSVLRRDTTVIGVVGAAHFFSHFFQLALPPLFPFLVVEFGVGYAELGLIPSTFYLASGICQAVVGVAVDRYGARPVLLAGLTLLVVATGLSGFATEFWMLLPLAALAGIGNSVFHPADLSILSTKVSAGRMGRAYSIHQLGGALGYAASPVVILALALTLGWHNAILIAGLIGLGMVGLLVASGELIATEAGNKPAARVETGVAGGPAAVPALGYAALIAKPAMIMAFLYFFLSAAGGTAIQSFSIPALKFLYGLPIEYASLSLTIYLLASGGGILLGGIIADRTRRHDHVAIVGTVTATALILLVASGIVGWFGAIVAMAAAGFSMGVTAPSRDLIIRAATPRGATGKAFGFVYSGLDMGSTVIPVLIGTLVDQGLPQGVFLAVACLYGLTILTLLHVHRRPATVATSG